MLIRDILLLVTIDPNSNIPSVSPNGVAITTFHPCLSKNYPARIYHEAPAPIGSGPRPLYLWPHLLPSLTSQVLSESRQLTTFRTMELPEKTNRHHNRTAETPYLFTPITPQNRMSDPPLAETDNIGRCMNPKSRTGPRLRVQFARREI